MVLIPEHLEHKISIFDKALRKKSIENAIYNTVHQVYDASTCFIISFVMSQASLAAPTRKLSEQSHI